MLDRQDYGQVAVSVGAWSGRRGEYDDDCFAEPGDGVVTKHGLKTFTKGRDVAIVYFEGDDDYHFVDYSILEPLESFKTEKFMKHLGGIATPRVE